MAPFFTNLLNSPSFPNFASFGAGPSASPTKPDEGPLSPSPSSEAGPSTRARPDQRRQMSTTSTNLSVAGLSVEDALDGEGEGTRRRGGGQSRPTSWAPSTMTANEVGRDIDKERRRRRKKVAVETFIIVKPPPTASKNPLNLQIQLVMKPANTSRSRIRADSITGSIAVPLSLPPSPVASSKPLPDSSGDRGKRRASAPPDSVTFVDGLDEGDKTDEEQPVVDGTELVRSNSLKSTVSGASSKSVGSSASSVGGGRRIVPLYNLSVHNVMHATVVTDAGTDARVAKFLKRSLDITGVGSLEPTEIIMPSILNSPFSFAADDQPISRPLSLLAPLSPTSTRGMPTDDSPLGRNLRASLDLKLFSGGLFGPGSGHDGSAPSEEGSASKKLFGRMFKKKETSPYTARKSPAPSRTSLDVPSGPQSAAGSPQPTSAKLGGSVPPPNPSDHAQLGQPTFGTAPMIVQRRSAQNVNGSTLASAGSLPLPTSFSNSRAIGYSWSIRRWAKGNLEGWAQHLVAAANAGLEFVGAAPHEEHEGQVIFEWVKLRPNNAPPAFKRPSAERRPSGNRARSKSRGPSNLNPSPSPAQSQSSLLDPVFSPSPASKRSASPAPSRGEDDSDPEDSETPWTCSVWVKGTGDKQLLATLTPAPHHPKVVGVLKVPMDLTTVPLAATHPPSADHAQAEAAKRVRAEVALTEENLKDVVCVTAMWLVVREEFGGLGKRRKT